MTCYVVPNMELGHCYLESNSWRNLIEKLLRFSFSYLNFLLDTLILFVGYIMAYCFVVPMIYGTCLVDVKRLFNYRCRHKSHHIKDHSGFHCDIAQVADKLVSVSPWRSLVHLKEWCRYLYASSKRLGEFTNYLCGRQSQ